MWSNILFASIIENHFRKVLIINVYNIGMWIMKKDIEFRTTPYNWKL